MSKGLGNMLKQAQQMQQKLSVLQRELDDRELEVVASGGAVKIVINGKQEIKKLAISPDVIDPSDTEGLELILIASVNQAIKESKEMVSKAMSKVTGGMSIPGLF